MCHIMWSWNTHTQANIICIDSSIYWNVKYMLVIIIFCILNTVKFYFKSLLHWKISTNIILIITSHYPNVIMSTKWTVSDTDGAQDYWSIYIKALYNEIFIFKFGKLGIRVKKNSRDYAFRMQFCGPSV